MEPNPCTHGFPSAIRKAVRGISPKRASPPSRTLKWKLLQVISILLTAARYLNHRRGQNRASVRRNSGKTELVENSLRSLVQPFRLSLAKLQMPYRMFRQHLMTRNGAVQIDRRLWTRYSYARTTYRRQNFVINHVTPLPETMSDSGGSDHQSLESDSEPFASLILYEFKKKKNKQTSEEEEEYGETNRGKRKRANRSTVEAKKKAKMDDRNLNSSSFRHQHMQLRLRIPISVLSTLSNNPLAWMTYVGGAILGVEGNVPDAYPDKDDIENGDVFHFVADDALAGTTLFLTVTGVLIHLIEDYTRLTKAVDIGTILRRTQSMTATSLHLDFYESLLPRDGGCVFTGDEGSLFTHGTHLIPFTHQNTVSIVSLRCILITLCLSMKVVATTRQQAQYKCP